MSTKTGDFAASDLSADLAALRADITRLSDTMAGLVKAPGQFRGRRGKGRRGRCARPAVAGGEPGAG